MHGFLRNKLIRATMSALALICIICSWACAPVQAACSGIMIKNAWARASLGSNGAVYMKIVNHNKINDTLLSVEMGIAKKAQLH